jgi:membrane-bound lytic murein transglycosylase A
MKNLFLLVTAILFLSACTTNQQEPNVIISPPLVVTEEPEEKNKDLQLVPQNFSSLPNWNKENFTNFAQAYNRSCARVLKKNSQGQFGRSDKFGKYQEWQITCRKFKKLNLSKPQIIRSFFEQNFIPYAASAAGDVEGLFTGYFEASLKGSRYRHGPYQTPLRARPDDLVMVQLGDFRDSLKGQRIAGRIVNGRLKPYETHEQIINGGLPPAQDKPLVWVDSAIDAFFLQIQGSGIVSMDDGSVMRVGYAGQNGHPYYAVGRELIKRGVLTKKNVSMQSIRQWMEDNPDQAQDLMVTNKSYVFFRELTGEGPLGGEGIALTADRSLAIDRSIIPYGMPVWLSADHPSGQAKINRLMVTQDTGGAIRGAVRGDYFWGYGERAEAMAGVMKSPGRYWFLLPKRL